MLEDVEVWWGSGLFDFLFGFEYAFLEITGPILKDDVGHCVHSISSTLLPS